MSRPRISVNAAQNITIHEWILRINRSLELRTPRSEIAKVRKTKMAFTSAPGR